MITRVDGKLVRGRPHREWLDDDITDWCGTEVGTTSTGSGRAGSNPHFLAVDCVACVEHTSYMDGWIKIKTQKSRLRAYHQDSTLGELRQ